VNKSPFVTENIKLNYITELTTFGCGDFLDMIRRRLSKRGSLVFDEPSNTLKITDKREWVEAIKTLLSILDNPKAKEENRFCMKIVN
jgi:type II secretory pathway component HofQ